MPVSAPAARRLAALLIALAALCVPAAARAADLDPAAGDVHFVKAADSSFDKYTRAPTATQQQWMREHYSRMRAWAPYFDSRLSWFRNAWMYKDAYAIYRTEALADQHPEWILRDGAGSRLYIQFACGGGVCPQYAADIGSADFRARWIADAKAQMAAGYRGIFVDDVNLEMRISDGWGRSVAPIDPRTGAAMTDAAWKRYMADFMEQIRAAFPGAEIVHNALWFLGDGSPDVARELRAADLIELERGVNDGGITGGTGQYSLQAFLSFIDHRHAEGHGVIFDAGASTVAAQTYGLASYFLISSGRDGIGNDPGGTPDDWWKGYDVRLGAPSGARYASGGVLRRDFAHGTVLVNEPSAPSRTVQLGAGFQDLDGNAVSSVTLGPASGAVLLHDAGGTSTDVSATPVPSPPPTPAPSPTPAPAPSTTASPAPAPAAAPSPAPTSAPAGHTHKPPKPRGGARVGTRALRLRRGAVLVSGNVHGARSGRVDIVVQRKRGNRWTRARRVTARVAADGRFGRVLHNIAPGRYRVQARFRGRPTARPSRSEFRRFTARS